MQAVSEFNDAMDVDAFKRAVHLDVSEDDVLIGAYITAAQEVVETATNRPLSLRDVQIEFSSTGFRRWWFPVCPVVSLGQIEWQDGNGWLDLDVSEVALQFGGSEPQLCFPSGFWDGVPDGAPVRVTARVGHDEAPKAIVQAMILIIKAWYEAGVAVEKTEYIKVSWGCRAIMKQSRYRRPSEWGSA